MDRATVANIQEWGIRPVADGYRGLQALGGDSFSGAVTTDSAWLFMLNGRVVGVIDGTLSTFESRELTAHEAPDPALPLLYAMQARGGDTRAKYYTDDDPLQEVHETLATAGFTGYIELSDNVLSGDYYVVYYGGKSMSVAFVGNAEKLVAGDEAFHQAADEVGIYEVKDVDLDVRDVPQPAPEEPEPEPPTAEPDPVDEATDEPPAQESPTEPSEATPATATDDEPSPVTSQNEPATGEDPASPTGETTTPAEPAPDDPTSTPPPAEDTTTAPTDEPDSSTPADAGTVEPAATRPDPSEAGDEEDPFSEEEAWREARTIPALDPEETAVPEAAQDGGQQPRPSEPDPEPEPVQPEGPPTATPEDDDRLAELEAAIETQSETIAELESRLESTSADAEQLREERRALQKQLEAARTSSDAGEDAPATGESLDRSVALDQTDLFVRYGTRGGGTLEKAHDGVIDREEVVENLRIDHHTRFEDAGATVDGQPFETFLKDSLEYRFVDWLVTDVLFEIQDTGSQRGLRDVFDAIPLIDRVEFEGTVTWRDQEAGETLSETFDAVCRDRMGQALVVANLNDVRDPATGEMMKALIEGAATVAEGNESLGGAFMVTSSFFRPDALETASEATGGGLLAREKRWSYVKQSRRNGFHLCLVEARGDDFHVAVPEL